jgi:hypothetical protein
VPDKTASGDWGTVLEVLPGVTTGRWAIGGSLALVLHGLPVQPRDVDIVADHAGAAALLCELAAHVAADESPWRAGDVHAARRAALVISGVTVEILVDVSLVAGGDEILGPPDLGTVEWVTAGGHTVPVLPLAAMLPVLEARGATARADMVRRALSCGPDAPSPT